MSKWEFCDDFSAGAARPEWRFDDAHARVTPGALELDGRASFWLQLPEPAYAAMEAEFDFRTDTQFSWMAGLGAYMFNFGGNMAPESAIGRDSRSICSTERNPLRPGTVHRARLSARGGAVAFFLDGDPLLEAQDPGAMQWLDQFSLLCWGQARLSRFVLRAEPLPAATARKFATDAPYELALVVDFPDDLFFGGKPFTPAMFADMFDHFGRWGVRHVEWLQYRTFTPLAAVYPEESPDAQLLARQLKCVPDVLPLVTRLAHERGMKLFAQYKLFDQVGRDVRPAQDRGRNFLELIGNRCAELPEELEPDALLQRNMTGVSPDVARTSVRRIRLVNRDDRAPDFADAELEVWVSADNRAYRKLSQPLTVRRGVEELPVVRYEQPRPCPTGEKRRRFVITIEGLDVREPYLAVVAPKRATLGTLGNHLFELVEILDENGRLIPFLFGIEAGQSSGFGKSGDFRTEGIDFDVGAGMYGFLLSSDPDRVETVHFVDNDKGFIGIAKGKNPRLYMLDPSEPCARQHWLRGMVDCLAAGVDGIDVRYRAHVKTLEWMAYGFNRPILEEYLRRTGVDIRTEPFDRALWRTVRGEMLTEFLRSASRMVRGRGGRFHSHLDPGMEPGPDGRAQYDMDWQWRRWLEEGLLDGITLKQVPIGSRFFCEMKELADARRVPIYETPYLANYMQNPHWPDKVTGLLDRARRWGLSGFMIYECCTLLQTQPGSDRLTERYPGAGELFARFPRTR